jgi:transposase InsO family protein
MERGPSQEGYRPQGDRYVARTVEVTIHAGEDAPGLGIQVRRLLTDNGPCYRSRAFSGLCQRLQLRHRRTWPYTPRTNGKAERFIQTAIREWAYARAYSNSQERKQPPPLAA